MITYDIENPKYIHVVLGPGKEKILPMNKAKLVRNADRWKGRK